MGIIGQSIPVRDAAMKVTGQFKYTADLEFPGICLLYTSDAADE